MYLKDWMSFMDDGIVIHRGDDPAKTSERSLSRVRVRELFHFHVSTRGAAACFTPSRLKTYFKMISALWSSALRSIIPNTRLIELALFLDRPHPQDTSFISVFFFLRQTIFRKVFPSSFPPSQLFMKKMARYRGSTCWLTTRENCTSTE